MTDTDSTADATATATAVDTTPPASSSPLPPDAVVPAVSASDDTSTPATSESDPTVSADDTTVAPTTDNAVQDSAPPLVDAAVGATGATGSQVSATGPISIMASSVPFNTSRPVDDGPQLTVSHAADIDIRVSDDEDKHLNRNFDYHMPNPMLAENFDKIRQMAKLFAAVLLRCCPNSRERATALTKVEEAMFWGNAAVARSSENMTMGAIPGA